MDFKVYDISVIPLIIFLTRTAIGLGMPRRFSPLISILLGVGTGIAYFSPENVPRGILIGVFLAASSVGFYSGTKNVYQEYRVRSKSRKKNSKKEKG